MKEIKLSHGKYAIVDDEDFEELSKHSWSYSAGKGLEYALASINNMTVMMHQFIMKTPKGMQTDHINHNGLDNRKCNLRLATPSQNQANAKLRKDNKTGVRGVCFAKNKNNYQAQIRFCGKHYVIGNYKTIEEAKEAYQNKAHELFGDFVNF